MWLLGESSLYYRTSCILACVFVMSSVYNGFVFLFLASTFVAYLRVILIDMRLMNLGNHPTGILLHAYGNT